MLHLHKINPMVRAVGTVGAVAALVGGITFAAQTSNTVTLTDNTLASATAALAIGDTTTTCSPVTGTTATGMSFTSLVPGTPSSAFTFCLTNTGTAPLSVSMTSPTNFTTSAIPASDVTLNVACGTTTATPVTLDNLGTPTVVDTSLAAGATDTCTATATLNSSFSGSAGTVTPFDLDFMGTSTTV